MKFFPEEVLFCPTTACNLHCAHCTTPHGSRVLSKRVAVRFLRECKKLGIKRVGFTGGEPFLAPDFLCSLSRETVRLGMLFDQIMTNAVWFKSRGELCRALTRLHEAGYDGSICVSVDAFHKQDLRKVAVFIREAVTLWGRPDIVSIAAVVGARDSATKTKLRKLAKFLGGSGELSIRIKPIELSPIGKALRLKSPWDGKWFREDHCKGPGNIFYVLPNGDVKPCCGYATDRKELTIGNIKHDSAARVMKNARANKFVTSVFTQGLASIRKRLEKEGVRFPGKASNHCFFCDYILNTRPITTF